MSEQPEARMESNTQGGIDRTPGRQVITRFGILRHARTCWNEIGKIQGQQDSALTDKGRQDALAWGKLLAECRWDRILSSDLGRAVETAQIIRSVLDIPLTLDARLREMDWGLWTGWTLADIRTHFPTVWDKASAGDWHFSAPEGERYIDVHDRSSRALMEAAVRFAGKRILVVCHEGTLKCLYYHPGSRRAAENAYPPMQSGCLQLFCADAQGLFIDRPNALVLQEPAPSQRTTG
jgi:probable phosphoglycerate mutase